MDAGGLGGAANGSATNGAPRARVTGVIYLSYFVMAIVAQVLVGRKMVVAGDVVNLVGYGLYVVLAVRLYWLFHAVSVNLSLVAAVFSLLGCLVGVLDVFHRAPAQVNALIFFGPYCVLLGVLILRSRLLPRVIGAVMVLAGVGWLVFLVVKLPVVVMVIEGVGILAEASLMLWLLVMGVDKRRWVEQAGAGAAD